MTYLVKVVIFNEYFDIADKLRAIKEACVPEWLVIIAIPETLSIGYADQPIEATNKETAIALARQGISKEDLLGKQLTAVRLGDVDNGLVEIYQFLKTLGLVKNKLSLRPEFLDEFKRVMRVGPPRESRERRKMFQWLILIAFPEKQAIAGLKHMIDAEDHETAIAEARLRIKPEDQGRPIAAFRFGDPDNAVIDLYLFMKGIGTISGNEHIDPEFLTAFRKKISEGP